MAGYLSVVIMCTFMYTCASLTFLLHLLEVPPNHESILTLLQPQVGISAALCSQLLKSVLTSVQGRPGASLDQGVSGHMPHAQSLAAAIPEGLMAASSKSLGLSSQPSLPLPSSSRRRSLDRGGSRSVRTCRLHNGLVVNIPPSCVCTGFDLLGPSVWIGVFAHMIFG